MPELCFLLCGATVSILESLKKVSLRLHFTLSVTQNHDLFWFVSYLHHIFYVQFVFLLERGSIHLIQHTPASSQFPTILYSLESISFLFLDPTQVLCFIYRLWVYIFLLFMEYLDAFLLPSYMECPCHNFLCQEHMVLHGACFSHGSSLPSLWPPPPSVADKASLDRCWVWNYCFPGVSVFPFWGSFPYFVGVLFLVIS